MTLERTARRSSPKPSTPQPAEDFALSTRVISGRFASQDADKLRGGYYTPPQLTRWLANWAIRKSTDRVLEPSCGDGGFVDAAAVRLLELGAPVSKAVQQLRGIEIVPTEAEKARTRLRPTLGIAGNKTVETADFFSWAKDTDELFDVVIGNPPFIRYQSFPEPSRTLAMTAMVDEGLKPNKLTNIWVPFIVAAATKLERGGRMALVIPAELLQVTYAGQLRRFLTDRFSRIDVVACNELFFDGAEQEVVLVLAQGARPAKASASTCKVAVTEAATVRDITSRPAKDVLAKAETKEVDHTNEKWLKYFLSSGEIELMRALRAAPEVTSLSTHGSIDVGVVTGKNEVFVVTDEQVRTWGLEGFTIPLVSRAAHLKGARIDKKEWAGLAADGQRVHLLALANLGDRSLPARLMRYLAEAEENGAASGYKCSIRKPWYGVPSVWEPDGFFFRQIYDFPRVVKNGAGATSTDTIHRLRAAKPDALITNIYTHLTAASSEIEGRSYGGGVLELEPTEAERLLMPTALRKGLPLEEVDKLVRAGRLQDVLTENDRLILGELGIGKADRDMLAAIWRKMRDRRLNRKRRKADV